jgi:hypothetical protein
MSALPDSDVFDVFDRMEIEKRLSFAVGYAFQRAYLEEDEFARRLPKLYEALANKQNTNQVFHVGDATRMFLGSSYRTAKAARMIFEEAQLRRDNMHLYQKLMLVHHDLVDGIVHPLYTALNYLTRPVVAQTLEIDPNKFKTCFQAAFGKDWINARDALAHEDERMVPKVIAEGTDRREIEKIQFRSTAGNKIVGLHARNSDGNSFEFDFAEYRYLELVTRLENLITNTSR